MIVSGSLTLRCRMLGMDVGFNAETAESRNMEDYSFFELLDSDINSTRFYMLVMYGLIRANGYRDLVETGVFRGVTTAFLARAAKLNGGHVTSIDIDQEAVLIASLRLKTLKLRDYVSFRIEDSKSSQGHPCDFVFVDGNHLLEGVTADWDNWHGHLRIGGAMAFHDSRDPAIAVFLQATFPRPDYEFINFPGDCGLALVRRLA